ncbi:MAG: hypothetical protein ACKPBU_06055, partial [Alphaproteobacteria bacterium]
RELLGFALERDDAVVSADDRRVLETDNRPDVGFVRGPAPATIDARRPCPYFAGSSRREVP